jgi:hypothetical protein
MNSHNSLHSIKRLVFLTDVVFSVRYEVFIQIYRLYNYQAQGPLTTEFCTAKPNILRVLSVELVSCQTSDS